MIQTFDIFAGVIGALMSLGHYPQAYKIWRTKNSGSVSLLAYGIFSLGSAVWLAYGLIHRQPAIIASWALGVFGSWLVLGLSIYYRNNGK